MSNDLYSQEGAQVNIPIPERRTYVPKWGFQHTDMSVQVRENGQPVGFTVGQVLPERRWAVTPSGELMPHNDEYRGRMRQFKSLICAPDGTIFPTTRHLRYFDPRFEGIKSPRDFVDARPDPTNPQRYIPIGYEHPAEKPKMKPLYNSNGELVEEAGETEPPLGFVPVPVDTEDEPAEPSPFMARAGKQGWYDILNTQTGETVKKVRKTEIEATIEALTQ